MHVKDKTVALFEWGEETPFVQACEVLTEIGEAAGREAGSPKTISVDAMVLEYVRGEVADRYGCIKASEHHEVVVYEDRGEDLSFLKSSKRDAAAAASNAAGNPSANTDTKSGSERHQEKAAEEKAKSLEHKRASPEERVKIKKGLKKLNDFLSSLVKPTSSRVERLANRQETAVAAFMRETPRVPEPPKSRLTRADKGQVIPPRLRPAKGPLDHAENAFLEYQAIVAATKEVHRATCDKILQTFRRENEGLLRVRLEEADAAVYDNGTSQIIKGTMSGSYMAAYNATSGFVALDKEETNRTGRITFQTPETDPIVVAARCTKIMLEDKILEMAQTIQGTFDTTAPHECWAVPRIRWVNGVPGCGKTTWVVGNFDERNDVIATTTTEATKDLREKLAHRLGDQVRTKVRTMASILVKGFRESERCRRLTVDEALMNHFGAIVMAARLSGASEVVLIGDINQLPYMDRENLFELRYCRPSMVAPISQELLCTHRNPMDVAYALREIYKGIYSSKSQVHSLKVEKFTGAQIPATQPNTLFLVHTQELKASLTSQGYGSGPSSRTLTIHEAQGLTCESVIVIRKPGKILQIHDSVPHAVVAVSRHTASCVYYTDDDDDATGRLARDAMLATTNTITDYNLRVAMQHRDVAIVEALINSKKPNGGLN